MLNTPVNKNTEIITILREKILNHEIDTENLHSEEWVSAEAIITKDKERKAYPKNLIVYTEKSEIISWYFYYLNNNIKTLNIENKYVFFGTLASLINNNIQKIENENKSSEILMFLTEITFPLIEKI